MGKLVQAQDENIGRHLLLEEGYMDMTPQAAGPQVEVTSRECYLCRKLNAQCESYRFGIQKHKIGELERAWIHRAGNLPTTDVCVSDMLLPWDLPAMCLRIFKVKFGKLFKSFGSQEKLKWIKNADECSSCKVYCAVILAWRFSYHEQLLRVHLVRKVLMAL